MTYRFSLLTLLLALAALLVACPTGRRGGGGGGGSDDDDSAAEDDDDAGPDDDDAGPDDDDVGPDDDDAGGDPQIWGTWEIEWDLGPEYEEMGLWDCVVSRDIVHLSADGPSGCPGCDVAFEVFYEYNGDTDCQDGMFETIDDVTGVALGFGDDAAHEWYDGQWYQLASGNMSGGASSGSFEGESDSIPQEGYDLRIVVDASWN